MMLDPGSGKVEFQTPEAARMAVQQLDGSELDGRQLHVTRQLHEIYVMLWRFCSESCHCIFTAYHTTASSGMGKFYNINHLRTTTPHQHCGLPILFIVEGHMACTREAIIFLGHPTVLEK